MPIVWLGAGCALAGAVVLTFYTAANFRLRRKGADAAWRGGWLTGGIGMSLNAAGWMLLALAGPHYELLGLQVSGCIISALALALYFLAALHVGRLRPRARYSLQLNTAGLYKLVRHPQALAICLFVVGLALASLSRPFLIALPLCAGYWVAYAFIEERFELLPAFGEAYQRYRRETPAFLPTTKSVKAFLAELRRQRQRRQQQEQQAERV
jgi:protein-S-isoprenylcysteine O-methyltransferase Ste14